MKKAGRRSLCLTGAIFLLTGIMVFDMIRRAEGVIASHERRISEEIATFRKSSLGRKDEALLWANYTEALIQRADALDIELAYWSQEYQPLCAPILDGTFYRYEEHRDYYDRAYWLGGYGRDPLSQSAPLPESALVSLALPSELMFAGGVIRALARLNLETCAIQSWNEVLAIRGLSAPEAARYARIVDQLWQRRPRIRDAIRAQSVMERLRVIQVLRMHSDQHGTLREKPSWRSMFLWRIFIAQTLSKLDRLYQDLERIETLSNQESCKLALDLFTSASKAGYVPPVSSSLDMFSRLYKAEDDNLHEWAMMRLTLGLAWFRAEQGRFPTKLKELPPAYVSEIPPNIDYVQDALGFVHLIQPDIMQIWTVKCPK
jgi:hypothetical protein